MKEFKINQYITLKLIDGKTTIFVEGEEFKQCKYLLLNIPVSEIQSLHDLESIDEASERLDSSEEFQSFKTEGFTIPSEGEFWAHCSNLQVWAEHKYDTKLLHSNLAFPLLKKLTEAGDLLAIAVFKDEIAKRYNSGIETVRKFLEKGNFLRFFTKDEFYGLIDIGAEYEVVKELESTFDIKRYEIDIRNGHVIKLNIGGRKLKNLPEIIKNFEYLEILTLGGNSLDIFPNWIREFKKLKSLHFNNNNNKLETLPDTIGNLNSLEELAGFNNEIKRLPYSFGNLKSLRKVDLHNNKLEGLPVSIGNLRNLEELNLRSNNIEDIPESIGELRRLKTLVLANNNLSSIPKTIGMLNSLETLTIGNNNLDEIPDSVGNLRNLQILGLSNNSIRNRTLPKSFKKLVSLRELFLDGNPLGELPEFIYELPKLVILSIRNTKIRKSQNLKKKLKEKNIIFDI